MSQPITWAGSAQPRLLLVGEAWGEQEAMTRQPFVGSSGQELWRMLGEAWGVSIGDSHSRAAAAFRYGAAWLRHRDEWLEEQQIGMTNVFNLQPEGNKIEALCETKKENKHADPAMQLTRGWYLKEQYQPELLRLRAEITAAAPNLVVALGNTACWALLGSSGISSIRGNVTMCRAVPGIKCLPTYHPAGVLRQWSWRPIVVADLMKAKRQSESSELRRPKRQVIVNPSLGEIAGWVQQVRLRPPEWLAVDIETAGKQITCIGFARSRADALVIPFVDLKLPGGSYWSLGEERQAWQFVRQLLESPVPKLFQNGMYDLQYILRMGFRPKQCEHDTMLLHHSLFPELQKGLGFLGSIYTDEASWKLMRKGTPDTEKKDE